MSLITTSCGNGEGKGTGKPLKEYMNMLLYVFRMLLAVVPRILLLQPFVLSNFIGYPLLQELLSNVCFEQLWN